MSWVSPDFSASDGILGGLLIGSSCSLHLLFAGKITGWSKMVSEGLLFPLCGKKDQQVVFRWAFLSGSLMGGFVATLFRSSSPWLTGSVDVNFFSPAGLCGALLVGTSGFLVGSGTTIANGCTSGYGVCGLARLSVRSLVAVLAFMGSAVLSASVIRPWVVAHLPSTPQVTTATLPFAGVLGGLVCTALTSAAFLRWSNGAEANAELEYPRLSHAVSYASGVLFGAGLVVSSMVNWRKTLSFLNVASGQWDPQLMFVMGSALLVALPAFQKILAQRKPVCATRFDLPVSTKIDTRLVSGAMLFGLGWGLHGVCPGPGFMGLCMPSAATVLFAAAELLGCWWWRE
eukprot:gnl/Spiro4/16468_TR8854_c0_g1_i1.p1 gnl/Spiro4/16468_TR8854_c0_g1~~gnl/Spiro4/16468_TR8854_c0_g1_i1.p1  ORF type:complete len:344 (-),score=87.30 gnl/Spiro4/16468_TR8854_c0_g1_i1:49-1080(-)